jgi:hypothetical protein
MIQRLTAFLLIILAMNVTVGAQELYVFTEPASNMPTNAIAVRLTNEGNFNAQLMNRTIGEVMVGLNKNLMFHVQGFMSNMDGRYSFEGASIYAKYRFFSLDGERSHFRAALFGRASTSERRAHTEDINLEGDNSGFQGGLVLTQLLHKLALSATVGYNKARWEYRETKDAHAPDQAINYSLSSGYLLLPFIYKDYHQPNFNLYVELLGKTNPANGHSYLDLAPAVQLILNSKTRIDLGYRFQATGNMANRYLKNMYLARIEFNFFNALSKKN